MDNDGEDDRAAALVSVRLSPRQQEILDRLRTRLDMAARIPLDLPMSALIRAAIELAGQVMEEPNA